MEPFPLRGDVITLGQLLKAVGLAGSGGEAKLLLEGGGVRVNGEPEARRGRKLHAGDVVDVEGADEPIALVAGPDADAS